MTYYLGVDLGTTFTAAAIWRSGRVDIANLGNRAPTIPSVVLLRDDGSMLVGEAAERRAAVEPRRVAREYKRRFGDPTPIVLGGTPYSADGLTATMLRWVVDKVTESEGGPPAGVAVSYPANWGAFKTDLLDQAIARADLDRVATVTEPEAAAIHYASQERVEPGSIIAVYDLGGGTFDAAVLRKTAAGWDILGEPQGVERLGGVDIDEAVFQHVVSSLDGALDELDPDDPAALSAVVRLRADCVDAKEALSADTDVSIPVLLPNVQTEVRLTRAELEHMVRPALEASITALDRALRSANVKTAEVDTVLLVGGSSRVPLVAELVSSEVGRPVAVDAHPKYSVALGAAVVAAGQDVADAENRSEIAAVPEEPSGAAGVAGAAAAGAAMGGFAGAQAAPSAPGAPGAPGGPYGSTPPAGPPPSQPQVPAGGYAAAAAPPGGAYAAPASGYQSSPAGGYRAASSGGYGAGPSGGYPAGGGQKSRAPLWIALGAIAAVALVVGLIVATSGGDEEEPASPPEPTSEPTSGGGGGGGGGNGGGGNGGGNSGSVSDSELQVIQDSCEAGAMRDCDLLYLVSPVDSDFEAYAETCGGRETASTAHRGTCAADFADESGPQIPSTELSDAVFEALRLPCERGYNNYCDMLYWRTPVGSELETFGSTCGGRSSQPLAGGCFETYGNESSSNGN